MADNAIFNSAMVTLSCTVGASMLPEKYGGKGEKVPSPKLLVGTGLTFFGLALLDDAAPGVARPLALCVAVTAFTFYGLEILVKWFPDDNTQPKGRTP